MALCRSAGGPPQGAGGGRVSRLYHSQRLDCYFQHLVCILILLFELILRAQSRAYSRDPTVYDDPERFMPERFMKDGKLSTDVRDPATIAFGYGRR